MVAEVVRNIGIMPVNVGMKNPHNIIKLASGAEAAGLESVWTFEHVLVPQNYSSAYPYNDSGKMDAKPETNFYDPLITLAAVSAHTSRIRIGTAVSILPQANPLYLAKQAATLDQLSAGRLSLGLGIGWLQEEFQALNVPFERRGARFDDYIAAMRKLWSGETVEHKSEFLDWHGFKSFPLPVQDPLPILIGGIKGKAFERVARLGDGWLAPPTDIQTLKDAVAQIRAHCDAAGRDFAEIEITSMWTGQGGLQALEEYGAAGVHRLTVLTPTLAPDLQAGIERLGALAAEVAI